MIAAAGEDVYGYLNPMAVYPLAPYYQEPRKFRFRIRRLFKKGGKSGELIS